jgi:hypothetical protein
MQEPALGVIWSMGILDSGGASAVHGRLQVRMRGSVKLGFDD